MSTFFVYCRQSSSEQTSLEAQADKGQETAKNYPDHIPEVIKETGSGESIEGRPQFQALLTQLKTGDILSVWDSSRLGRNLQEVQIVRQTLRKRGVVIIEGGNVYQDTPTDTMMSQIIDTFSEFAKNLQKEKTILGIKNRRKKGQLRFGGCFGYDYDPRTKIVTVNHDEAKYVKAIFEKHLSGISLKGIALWLNLEHVQARDGGKWQHISVRRILLRPIYSGFYSQDSQGRSNGTYQQALDYNPDILVKSIYYEPIITPEMFSKSIDRFLTSTRQHFKKYDPRQSRNLWTGLLVCGLCKEEGRTETAARLTYCKPNKGTPYVHYKLNSTHKKHDRKAGNSFQEHVLNGLLKWILNDITNYPSVIAKLLIDKRESASTFIKGKQKVVDDLTARIDKINSSVKKATHLLLDEISPEIEKEIRLTMTEQIREREVLTQERQDLKRDLEAIQITDLAEGKIWVKEELQEIVDPVAPMEVKRKKLCAILDCCSVYEKHLMFFLTCGMTYGIFFERKIGRPFPKTFSGYWTTDNAPEGWAVPTGEFTIP